MQFISIQEYSSPLYPGSQQILQCNSTAAQEYILFEKEFSKNHRTSSDNTGQLFLLQNVQEKNAQISASWDCYRWFSALFLQTKIIYQVLSYKTSTQCPARGMNFVCQTVSFGFKFLTSGWPMRGSWKSCSKEEASWQQYQPELAQRLPVHKPSEWNSSFFHLKLCLWLFCFRQKTDLAAVLLFNEQTPCHAKTSSSETAEQAFKWTTSEPEQQMQGPNDKVNTP